MTRLRKMMLEELQRRNYSQSTTTTYIRTVEDFARYFKRRPDQLGPEHIREYQAQLFSKRKLAPNTVTQRLAALRFFFVKTLNKPWSANETPYPKKVVRLPAILSQEEVARLIDAAHRRSPLCRARCQKPYPPDAVDLQIRFKSHRARVRRKRGRLPSSRCIESEPAPHIKPLPMHVSCRLTSDTALGLRVPLGSTAALVAASSGYFPDAPSDGAVSVNFQKRNLYGVLLRAAAAIGIRTSYLGHRSGLCRLRWLIPHQGSATRNEIRYSVPSRARAVRMIRTQEARLSRTRRTLTAGVPLCDAGGLSTLSFRGRTRPIATSSRDRCWSF